MILIHLPSLIIPTFFFQGLLKGVAFLMFVLFEEFLIVPEFVDLANQFYHTAFLSF